VVRGRSRGRGIDCCAAPLARDAVVVAAHLCEAARGDASAFDVLASGDGLSDKDEADVALEQAASDPFVAAGIHAAGVSNRIGMEEPETYVRFNGCGRPPFV
jgi:hypothetical protein